MVDGAELLCGTEISLEPELLCGALISLEPELLAGAVVVPEPEFLEGELRLPGLLPVFSELPAGDKVELFVLPLPEAALGLLIIVLSPLEIVPVPTLVWLILPETGWLISAPPLPVEPVLIAPLLPLLLLSPPMVTGVLDETTAALRPLVVVVVIGSLETGLLAI